MSRLNLPDYINIEVNLLGQKQLINNSSVCKVYSLNIPTIRSVAHGAIFSTNVFGGLNVARAFLPYLRAHKSGTIVWIGSAGGWGSVPDAGLYSATKFAIRG